MHLNYIQSILNISLTTLWNIGLKIKIKICMVHVKIYHLYKGTIKLW
jgi:hypothetical protein